MFQKFITMPALLVLYTLIKYIVHQRELNQMSKSVIFSITNCHVMNVPNHGWATASYYPVWASLGILFFYFITLVHTSYYVKYHILVRGRVLFCSPNFLQ